MSKKQHHKTQYNNLQELNNQDKAKNENKNVDEDEMMINLEIILIIRMNSEVSKKKLKKCNNQKTNNDQDQPIIAKRKQGR